MAVGAALRHHRTRQGFSATALARAVGISNGHLSDIERGRRNPSPDLLRRLEKALGLSSGELQVPFTPPKALDRPSSEAIASLAAALGVSVAELIPPGEPRSWPTPAHRDLAILVALMLRVDPQAGIAARGIPDVALLSENDVILIAQTVREALTWALRAVTRHRAPDSDGAKGSPEPLPREEGAPEP